MASVLHPRHPASIVLAIVSLTFGLTHAVAESCVTQSQMQPADRDSLAFAARSIAASIQANDTTTLRTMLAPELAKDPTQLVGLVASTASRIKDAQLTLEQIYLLDASQNKSTSDAEFFCSINRTAASTDFQIPGLAPGVYGFAIIQAATTQAPWRLSLLLRRNLYQNESHTQIPWSIAGLYPKPLTAAGHDGVWYWTQARSLTAEKQTWNAYLFYQQAQALLQPAGFVSSTNLDKLRRELTAATPPALSEGISPAVPLVVKAADSTEYRFTAIAADDSLSTPSGQLDLLVHLQLDPPPEPPAADAPKANTKPSIKPNSKSKPPTPVDPRTRNLNAIAALVAAYPELRTRFHAIWIFADASGQNPIVTNQLVADIPHAPAH